MYFEQQKRSVNVRCVSVVDVVPLDRHIAQFVVELNGEYVGVAIDFSTHNRARSSVE